MHIVAIIISYQGNWSNTDFYFDQFMLVLPPFCRSPSGHSASIIYLDLFKCI